MNKPPQPADAPPTARSSSFGDLHRRASAGEPLTVVFFGGSITWGANASDPQLTSYRAFMARHLRGKYPRCPFTFRDAAIGGTGSNLGIFRLERDVLAHDPDLVFLDFTLNDGLTGIDPQKLDSYECILRELIGRGIAVEQIFFAGKAEFGANYNPESLERVVAHKKLAAAYKTAVGDVYPFIQQKLQEGAVTADKLWPFDGVHPDDEGYRLFAEAAFAGFERAVAGNQTLIVPPKPVFSDDYSARQRIRLVDTALPSGWRRSKTFRTSLWFDGLSSRWMDDVAVCDSHDKIAIQPLTFDFTGTFVGIFGEADQDGLSFHATVDGKPQLYRPNSQAAASEVWNFRPPGAQDGRLFVWRVLSDDLPPGRHSLVLTPIIPKDSKNGQLRIESICVAGR